MVRGKRTKKPTIIRELDPTLRSEQTSTLTTLFQDNVIGQEETWQVIVDAYERFNANLNSPGRPPHIHLIAGPTGCGKNRICEVFSKFVTGDELGALKIDCGEFQHSHEVARLVGAPPGYLGHKETKPLLSQDWIEKNSRSTGSANIVIFDEFEKAHESLRQLLLGVFDKGTLRLGDNSTVTFDKSFIFMTSNLGVKEEKTFTFEHREINFSQKEAQTLQSMKQAFSPEFINRLDHVSVVAALKREQIDSIFDLEFGRVITRIQESINPEEPLQFLISDKLRNYLIDNGTSKEYGARFLKRLLEEKIVSPLSRFVSTGQLKELAEDEGIYIDLKGDIVVFAVAEMEEPKPE